MSLALLVYAISLLGPLTVFSIVLVLVALVTALCFAMHLVDIGNGCYPGEEEQRTKSSRKYRKASLILAFCLSLFVVFTPSEKTAWLMTGAMVAQNVYESEAGDKLKKIVANKLDSILDEQLAEQTKSKK